MVDAELSLGRLDGELKRVVPVLAVVGGVALQGLDAGLVAFK
jgi:hypothetical protein